MKGVLVVALCGLGLIAGGCDSGAPRSERQGYWPARGTVAAPPPNSVALGTAAARTALAPPGPQPTAAVLSRGAERYAIFCAPCHGTDGRGAGAAVKLGFPRPPSLHEERLRKAPPAHVVRIITAGIGLMYPFSERIPPADRWAIGLYVGRLQQSRPEERRP